MTGDAMHEGEIEAVVAGVRRGELRLAGGPSDAGWSAARVGADVWYSSWFQHDDGRLDEEGRALDDDAVRALLRRYGRKVIRKAR